MDGSPSAHHSITPSPHYSTPFELLETLRWTADEGFFLLDRHLQRLSDSARYFDYNCSLERVMDALAHAVTGSARPLRVRLLVNRNGDPRVEHAPLEAAPGPLRVGLAARPIDPTDPFLFHKTTNRGHLERERLPSYDETVLWNPSREITEGVIANLVVDLGGRRVTPPVACGLLPGTMRAELLARGEIAEARISVEEFLQAPRVWLINSVRGWREGVLR
jgi:para-aminobenzoate synthetase/4-amino-4-deoxychorismate lyase